MTIAALPTTKLAFSVSVDSLLDAAIKVGSIVPARGDKPIVSNMKLSVHNGVLELSGTDLRAGIYHQLTSATVVTDGTGLIGGSRLLEVLKEFKGEEAAFSFDLRGGCKFAVKNDMIQIPGDDPRDFPKPSRFDSEAGFQITGRDLIDMIDKTEFAAAPEQNRLAINGVLFELKSGRFRLVATDTKRISYAQRAIQTDIADFSVVAPLPCLKLLKRAIDKKASAYQVTIGVSGSFLFVRTQGATVYTLVLNGRYPTYEDGFKAVLSKHIDFNVDTMLTLLRKIMLIDPNGATFDFAPGWLTVKSQLPTVGVGDIKMPTTYTGDTVRVGFSPKFIQEALESTPMDRCRLSFDGPKKIGLLKELKASDVGEVVSDDFCYAVMPTALPGVSSKSTDDR